MKGESFITVAGPKALENCALFRKVVYGMNGNSVAVQTKMWCVVACVLRDLLLITCHYIDLSNFGTF